MVRRTPARRRQRLDRGAHAVPAVLTVLGMLIAIGCGSEPAGEEVSTSESTPATSAPVEATDGGSPDAEPLDEPPAPDPSTLPDAAAPAGLGLPRLPIDADGVVVLFEALPVELLGASRQVVERDPGTIAATYDAGDRQCGRVGLQGIDLVTDAGNAYPDDWRAEDVVALFATGADWDVEDAGRDGARYWVTFETFCGGEDMERDEIISSAVWGDEGGTWTFFVGARNAAEREELLTAFVDAALTTLGPAA